MTRPAAWPAAVALFSALATACVSVASLPPDAPRSFTEARAVLDRAYAEGVDATLPRTCARAEAKLREALARYHDEPAAAAAAAAAARDDVMLALELHRDLNRWDDDIAAYAAMRQHARDAAALRKQLRERPAERDVDLTTGFAGPKVFELSKPLAFFAPGAAAVAAADRQAIDELCALLGEQPDLEVELIGYGDPERPGPAGEELAKRRADAVAALMTGLGVATDRIRVTFKARLAAGRSEGERREALARRVDARLSAVGH